MRAHDFISEALRPSQYRWYVKGWDKSRYNQIFDGKYRIYFPLQKSIEGIEPNKTVVDALESLGYKVTVEDYVDGYATKGNRKFKIGRILSNQYVGNEEMQDRVMALFVNDPARAGRSGDLLVVISRHPYDIAGMSTDRGWSSCMNLSGGAMRQYVESDVVHGTLVAYLIKSNDTNIKNPMARILIKPFINIKDPTNVIFGVENRVYGTAPKEFAKTVVQWADAINSSKVLTGLFKMPQELYRDEITAHQWYGSEDEAEQIEAVKHNAEYLKNMNNPSAAVVQAALNRDPSAIRYVQNPTPEQVEWALRAEGTTLQYIKNPTEQQIKTAVRSNPTAIRYVINPDEETQLLAVRDSVGAIRYIKNPTDRVARLAVLRNPGIIGEIKNPSEELQLHAIRYGDEYMLKYIKEAIEGNPSKRVIYAALNRYPVSIRFVDNPSRGMQAYAVKRNPDAVRWIYHPSETIQLLAVRGDASGELIRYIAPSERVQLAAIAKSKYAYKNIYVGDRTPAAYKFFKQRWPKYYRKLRREGWMEFPDWVNVETERIGKGRVYEEQ